MSRAREIAVAIIGLSLLAVTPLSLPTPRPAESQHGEVSNLTNNQGTADKTPAEHGTMSTDSLNSANNGKSETKDYAEPTPPIAPTIIVRVDNHDTTIAAATVVLAVVGLIQLCLLGYTYKANERNAAATESSAAIANAALVAANRPRVIVRRVSVTRLENNSPIMLQFIVANVGGSPAHIYESNVTIVATKQFDLPAIPPYEDYGDEKLGKPTLESGTSLPYTVDSKGLLGDIQMLQDGRMRLLLLGYVQYRDNAGNVRRTAFCRQMAKFQRRFSPVLDNDYEYAD